MNEYDPTWPFPQFDEQGRQLLPPAEMRNTDRNEKHKVDLSDLEEAPW